MLQVAKVVNRPHSSSKTAHLESVVTLKDLTHGDELVVTLVGSYEADPSTDKVSITSPFGSALLDKEKDDEIEVDAPAGKQKYKVLLVE